MNLNINIPRWLGIAVLLVGLAAQLVSMAANAKYLLESGSNGGTAHPPNSNPGGQPFMADGRGEDDGGANADDARPLPPGVPQKRRGPLRRR